MEKIKNKLLLLFFLFIFLINIFLPTKNIFLARAVKKNIRICENNNCFEYEIFTEKNQSKLKEKIFEENNIEDIIKNLKNMGFNEEQISIYLFPEIEKIFENLSQRYFEEEVPDEIVVLKNKCQFFIENGKEGKYINKKLFYQQFLNGLLINENIKLDINNFKNKKLIINDFVKKSSFSTNFSSSSDERKNNIKTALAMFDGIILEQGEILSFNKTTGLRNKDRGYQPAKIISSGTFIEGYGGGVCQVSTTLYNASLLAGLEILEVHSHSLPVSYVEPSFDAMVNSGSSDLVIKNNSEGQILITTSFENDICKVVIFGKQNNFNIKRVSEKTEIIPAEKEYLIDTNFQKYGLNDLEVGEEKQVSYAKDGFCSNGYLQYYDNNGNLIKTKKIRETKYNPTRGVVVKKEN